MRQTRFAWGAYRAAPCFPARLGPRFVAAVRKARLWLVPLVSYGLGPDEAGPSPARTGPDGVLPPSRSAPLRGGQKAIANTSLQGRASTPCEPLAPQSPDCRPARSESSPHPSSRQNWPFQGNPTGFHIGSPRLPRRDYRGEETKNCQNPAMGFHMPAPGPPHFGSLGELRQLVTLLPPTRGRRRSCACARAGGS